METNFAPVAVTPLITSTDQPVRSGFCPSTVQLLFVYAPRVPSKKAGVVPRHQIVAIQWQRISHSAGFAGSANPLRSGLTLPPASTET